MPAKHPKRPHGRLWKATFTHVVYFYGPIEYEAAQDAAETWYLQELCHGGGVRDPALIRVRSIDDVDVEWREAVAWNTPDDSPSEILLERLRSAHPLREGSDDE